MEEHGGPGNDSTQGWLLPSGSRPRISYLARAGAVASTSVELLKLAPGDKFPGADADVVDQAVPLVTAFDAPTAYAISFGIAKFQLAQHAILRQLQVAAQI